MKYETKNRKIPSVEANYEPREVHSWKPPCSCGVELCEALQVEEKVEVHSWRPPCSCGVSLNEIIE